MDKGHGRKAINENTIGGKKTQAPLMEKAIILMMFQMYP